MPLPPSLSLRVGAPGQGRLVLAALNHCAQPPRGEECFPPINALFVLPEIARGPRSPLLISSLEIAAHIRRAVRPHGAAAVFPLPPPEQSRAWLSHWETEPRSHAQEVPFIGF